MAHLPCSQILGVVLLSTKVGLTLPEVDIREGSPAGAVSNMAPTLALLAALAALRLLCVASSCLLLALLFRAPVTWALRILFIEGLLDMEGLVPRGVAPILLS